MRFCSIIALGGLVAGVSAAADPSEQSRRITSVVRSDPRTGRLVRSVVVTPKTVGERTVTATVVAPRAVSATLPAPEPEAAAPTGIDAAVEKIAAQHSVPAELLHSVIKIESNYNPNAVSAKGALGLMQLIPATARRFGVSDVFNPAENIEGGARYLRYLLDLYNWDLHLTLAAYNAGEAAVAKYGGIPPYAETRNYIVSVDRQLEKKAASTRKPQPAAVAAKPAPRDPAAPNPIREIVETDGTIRYVSR
jgi:soluble lytic murein transglycosylase-like protein